MSAGVNAREQRLRKQAELQSLQSQLVNLRSSQQEQSYISSQATIPPQLTQQIDKLRQQLEAVEDELISLGDEAIASTGRQLYREAFKAELAEDFEKALKLYKQAARNSYPDAQAAARSLGYRLRTTRPKTAAWASIAAERPKSRFPWAVIVTLLIFVLIFTLLLNNYLPEFASSTIVSEVTVLLTSTATPSRTPLPATVIIPATATLTPTGTRLADNSAEPTPLPSATPIANATDDTAQNTPPPPPVTPTELLKIAPVVIGPKDGLVWGDGAIVFEFEDMNIREDELYCLNTLRGYDDTLTENWSHPPIGRDQGSIPIEVNVFRVAKTQGIQCITWSAYIGRGTCENVVSQETDTFVIGLPRPCELDE